MNEKGWKFTFVINIFWFASGIVFCENFDMFEILYFIFIFEQVGLALYSIVDKIFCLLIEASIWYGWWDKGCDKWTNKQLADWQNKCVKFKLIQPFWHFIFLGVGWIKQYALILSRATMSNNSQLLYLSKNWSLGVKIIMNWSSNIYVLIGN